MVRLFIGMLVALLLCGGAMAQQGKRLPDIAAARRLTDEVMAKVAVGKMEEGMRLVLPYAIVPEAEIEVMVGQAKMQLPMMAQRFGKSVGSEFIREDKVGDSLLRVTHIQRFERHAAVWTFVFYKTPAGWCVNTFYFNDKVTDLFSR